MRDCVRRLVEASKNVDGVETLSQKAASDLLDEVRKAAEIKSKDGSDLNDNIIAELSSQKIRAKIEGELQKRNAAINILKQKELKTKIDEFVAEGLTIRKAMQAVLVGVQGVYKAGRLSVDAKVKAVHKRYLGGFAQELEANDLLAIVNQKALQPEIEKELYALGTGNAGVTKSKEALQIAKIIHKYNEALRLRQNRAGASIDKLESFTATQSHDRVEMRKQGYTAWRDKIIPLLDKERTFKGADAEEFLSSAYEVLTTGISRKTIQDEKLFEFKGAANLAKKVSRARVLHFKDAESSIQYRNEFGKRDFMEGVMQNIEHSSRNIALMETFGTNPRAMFEKVFDDTKKKYRSDASKIKDVINDRAIRNFYNEVDGSTMIPESPSMAQVGAVLRAIQTLSKLGGVLISSLTDIPNKAAELQFRGFGVLESYGISLSDIRVSGSEKKQLGALLGVGMDGMVGSIASRWSASDDLPGSMASLQRLFFKLNGLQWWTDAHKRGTGMAMSHRLATFKDVSFNKLDADTKRSFDNFGITEKEWDVIRKTATKQVDDREYITPDTIRDAEGLSEKQKDIIEDKLRAYFIDISDAATLTPDARERAVLTQGLKRGTVEGELFRIFTQFKSFPVTMISKVYGRALYGKGKADVPALVQTAIMTTLFGYVAMSGKDLAKGREPRPLDNVNTWKAAFLQGGGAGILGDFALGEYSRFGNDLTTTLAGATFSTLNDIARLYAAAKNGDDTAAKGLNLLLNNAPGANLIYLRPALNYMFIYQLQEALNPGYLRRMERRVEKENNQKFLIKPSSVQ
jgi:hypothetical protein